MIWCCSESFSCPCREVPCHDLGRARSGPASLFDCAKHHTAGGRHHGLLKAKLEALDGQKAARVGERFCSKARLQLRAAFGRTELRFIVGSPHHSERNRISEDHLTVLVDNHTHQKHSKARPAQFSLERCISTCQYGIRPLPCASMEEQSEATQKLQGASGGHSKWRVSAAYRELILLRLVRFTLHLGARP